MTKGFAIKEKTGKLISSSLEKNGILEDNFEEVIKRACNTKYCYIYLVKISPIKINGFMKDPYHNSFLKSLIVKRYILTPSFYKYLKNNNHTIQKNVYMKWIDDLWIDAEEVTHIDRLLDGEYRGVLVYVDVNKMHNSSDPIKKNELKEAAKHYIQIGKIKGKESYTTYY